MAIKIGHASIDENKKATGGNPGDQTGKEVCTRNWYNGGWQYLIRAKNSTIAESIAATCEAGCANDNIGYDQSGRNTLYNQAKLVGFDLSKITEPCEADCSSFAAVCVRAALGRDFYTGNAPTTRNLRKVLTAVGGFEVLSDSKYLSGTDYLRRGDILLTEGKHTVIVLDSGAKSTIEESSTVAQPTETETVTIHSSVRLPVLQRGSKGEAVKAMQMLLVFRGENLSKYGCDGEIGSETESALKVFQRRNGLTADGKCGAKTWEKLLGL